MTGFRGAAGEFPHGQMNENEQDPIQFATDAQGDKFAINFGAAVRELGMTQQQKIKFASTLLKKAKEVGRKTGETITVML